VAVGVGQDIKQAVAVLVVIVQVLAEKTLVVVRLLSLRCQ
jgi:hypothetical protein